MKAEVMCLTIPLLRRCAQPHMHEMQASLLHRAAVPHGAMLLAWDNAARTLPWYLPLLTGTVCCNLHATPTMGQLPQCADTNLDVPTHALSTR
jgi:hypothetical protein